MQMRHCFAGVWAIVEHQPEAGLGQPQFISYFCGLEQEMTEDLMILGTGLGNARDGLLRDDQHMGRGLGFDILKSQDQVVFVNDRGGNLTRDDFLEKSFAHGKFFTRISRICTV